MPESKPCCEPASKLLTYDAERGWGVKVSDRQTLWTPKPTKIKYCPFCGKELIRENN